MHSDHPAKVSKYRYLPRDNGISHVLMHIYSVVNTAMS